MGEQIRFYRVGDAYGEFSNFSPLTSRSSSSCGVPANFWAWK